MDKNFYNLEYLPKMHRIGKIIGVLAVVASFLPALTLGLVYGLWPDWAALGTAALTAISSFAVLWFVEPLSYYPVVGPMGTYMAFVSGNISNMRIPCASMAQVAAEVEPGTDEGSIVATIGMGVSIVINTLVLSVGVVAGQAILGALPEAVNVALSNYLLTALFGALIVQFGMKAKGHTVVMLAIGCFMYIAVGKSPLGINLFGWLSGASNYLPTLACVFISVGIMLVGSKKKAKA